MIRHVQRKSITAGALLLCFVIALTAASHVIANTESVPERIGALLVPFAFLVAGCWFAFRGGGIAVKVCASVLVLVTVGSFGIGFAGGLAKRVKRQDAARQVNAEIAEIRTSMVEGQDSPEELSDRMRESASRMESSDDPDSAAIGKYLKFVADTTEAPGQRLATATEAVTSDWFLDLGDLLRTGEFERHRKATREYQGAAKAMLAAQAKVRDVTRTGLSRFEMKADVARGVQSGFNRTYPLSLRVLEAHVQVAICYASAIDFIETNRAEIEIDSSGEPAFSDGEIERGYTELYERMGRVEAELNAAIDAYTAAMSPG